MTTDPITGRAIYTVSEQICLDEARIARQQIEAVFKEIWRKWPSLMPPDYRPDISHYN